MLCWFMFFILMQIMGPSTDFDYLRSVEPSLFTHQFENARWLFLPICSGGHWMLMAVDIPELHIKYYNSLDGFFEKSYWQPVQDQIDWLKFFLKWRLSEYRFYFLLLSNY